MGKVKRIISWGSALVLVICGFFYVNYLQWEVIVSSLINTKVNMENSINLKELLLKWDEKDNVPTVEVSKEDIKRHKEALTGIERNIDECFLRLPWYRRYLFSVQGPCSYDVSRMANIYTSMDLKRIVASVVNSGEKR